MINWRDNILKEFISNVSKLTLVADPDGLLTEEKLSLELRQRGFDLIEFSDPIEFRYVYESKYRSIWDCGEHTDLVVVLHLKDAELVSLPYDLLQVGRKLTFNLGEIFPNLSYPVIDKLDRSLLDTLYDAQVKTLPDRMGDNATKDFIFRSVFGIAAELIINEVELLRVLLRLHYGKIQISHSLAERLVQVLNAHTVFHAWPLNEVLLDDEAFFAFLQERWPVFLSRYGTGNQAREDGTGFGFKYPGPEMLPFEHQDIRVYIDNLFVEGKLTPIHAPDLKVDAGSWIRSGVAAEMLDDNEVRIARLFEFIERDHPSLESLHSDWIEFALKWAELSALVHSEHSKKHQSRLRSMGDALNATFAEWLSGHYASLITLPPTNPAMLHHVPRRLARDMEEKVSNRVALIVVDGLALDQWVTIRQILQKQDRSLVIRESATFAWVPTLTSVSRQSIFSGKAPQYFPSSINSTNNEASLWKQFWESNGLSKLDIAYKRGLGDGDVVNVLDENFHPGKTKVVGLVVDKVDKIMHGMQLGAAGMHNQIQQWCESGFLRSLISYLLDSDYEVWLTSDHGNIECFGKGLPSEGVIAETRGERARIYPTSELRNKVAESFPFAYEWQPVGLPPNYFPLVTGGSDAFIKFGNSTVGHGGISIEEVIVPLVKFERNARK